MPTPKLDGTIDKSSISIDLGKSDMATVTLTASGDFAGTVNVATSLVDAQNNPITNVTVTAQSTAALATNGMVTIPVMIQVPSNATGAAITATLKVDITGGPAPINLTSSIAVSNVFLVIYPDGAGSTVANHQLVGANVTVKRGTIIRFKNEDTTPGITHITHGSGNSVFQHESLNAGQLGDVYDINTTAAAPGTQGQLGCHDHEGGSTYINFTIQ